jgi:hypothetical protein
MAGLWRQVPRAHWLNSAEDFLNFNPHQFWKPRLLLLTTDPERLGRYIRNHICRGKRRQSEEQCRQSGQFVYRINPDERAGLIYLHSTDTIQELIDKYGGKLRIQRVLVPLPNQAWLPRVSNRSVDWNTVKNSFSANAIGDNGLEASGIFAP